MPVTWDGLLVAKKLPRVDGRLGDDTLGEVTCDSEVNDG